MEETYDVIIVGGGTAGLAALREVRKRTPRFAIVNDGPWGTVCARVGCMPSKLLIEAANAFHRRHAFEAFGIRGAAGLALDQVAALQRLRRLRDDFVASTLQTTQALGDRAISGRARLLGADRLAVGKRTLRARAIILATGSRPIMPASWHPLRHLLLTTDTLFEQESLPARMAVIGMGPIGAEMAQALSRFGVDIAAFGRAANVAGLSDPETDRVARLLLAREFPLHLGAKADLEAAGDGVRVHSATASVMVDRVLVALGRRPNVDDIGLEALDVELDEDGLPPVDPHTMQIADLPVFLAGDANRERPLLHEAADGGHIAGINATRPVPVRFKRRTPLAIVFTEPGIAVVGSSLRMLSGRKILSGEVRFEKQGRARAAQRNTGIMRLYAEPDTGRLLGAELCAPAGEHMAHLLALAIDRALTVRDLLRLPFYHPVLEEGLRTAVRDLAAQLPPCGESDLAACDAFDAEALD